MIKKLFAILLLGLCSCEIGDMNVSINTEYFFPKKREISNADIEKRVRLFEPSVAGLIKSDYTFPRIKGGLSFAFSAHSYNGLYNESEDTIFIPENPKNKSRALDALCEEIAHASTDDVEHKGILYSSRYKGPPIEEITEKMKERFGKEDMVQTKQRWERILELRYMMDEQQELTKIFQQDYIKIAKNVSEVKNKQDEIDRLGQIIASKVSRYQNLIGNQKAKDLYTKVRGGFKCLTDEEVSYLLGFVKEFVSLTKDIGKDLCKLDEKIAEFYPELKVGINSGTYIVDSDHAKEAKEEMDQEFCFKEQFGKTIYCLVNLYYGPTEIEAYELDEPMLRFLERFILDDQPMFKKQIEKYRLGKQMAEDGISPGDVRDRLMFATEFEYKEKKYNWPDNGFTIKGTIPDEFSLEYLSVKE